MALKLPAGKNFNRDNLVKNLAYNHKLVTHLDRAIKVFDEPWTYTYEPKELDDAWHPSGDCTPSVHELWLKATHPQKREFAVSSMKNFQVGHFFHQYLQHILVEKLGFAAPEAIERRGSKVWGDSKDFHYNNLAYGKDVNDFKDRASLISAGAPYHWATGSADVAPCDIPGYGECIVDFKTMNSIMFKRPYPPEGFAQKWECQVNIYMDWFDQERAIIVGVQKDNPHDMKEFEYHRNQPLIDAIYEKWHLVSDCLDEGVEPPADHEFDLPLGGHIA